MPLTIGTRLGSYEIVAPLGAGGMGEVYRARDTRLKREVALKVLPEGFSQDADRLARFQREAELAQGARTWKVKRRKVKVKVEVKGCVFLLMLSGVAAVAAQQRSYLPAEIEGGGRLYQANCTSCHGPEGDGIAGVNFSKGQLRRATSDEDLVRIIVRGIPGTPMPPSNFSEGQSGTIVAYLRWMAGAGGSAASGDAGRGKAVFDGKGQCITCHSVGGIGARVGPALTDVGAFRPSAELQRSLLDPDAEIRAENRSVRVTLRDGSAVTGRLLNQDTYTLQLLDSSERLVLLEKTNVREHTLLKNSAMPSYRDRLTAQELADLVGYLASLRGRQ